MGKQAKVNDSKYWSFKMLVSDKESWRSQQNIKGHCVTDKCPFLNTSGTKKIIMSGIHINSEDINNDGNKVKGNHYIFKPKCRGGVRSLCAVL